MTKTNNETITRGELYIYTGTRYYDNSYSMTLMLLLNWLYQNSKARPWSCITIDQIYYMLYGKKLYRTPNQRLVTYLKKSFDFLHEKQYINILEHEHDVGTYVLEDSFLGVETKQVVDSPSYNYQYWTHCSMSDIQKIFRSYRVKGMNPFKLVRFYLLLLSAINHKKKWVKLSQDYMCSTWNIGSGTLRKYLDILSELKLIYVHKSHAIATDGSARLFCHYYGRYEDREDVSRVAFEDMNGSRYTPFDKRALSNWRKSVKNKMAYFKKGHQKYNETSEVLKLLKDAKKFNAGLTDREVELGNTIDMTPFETRKQLELETQKFGSLWADVEI